MPRLEDLIVKPNALGPNGEPIFIPALNIPPLQGNFVQEQTPVESRHMDFESEWEDEFGSDPPMQDYEVPDTGCGCGG